MYGNISWLLLCHSSQNKDVACCGKKIPLAAPAISAISVCPRQFAGGFQCLVRSYLGGRCYTFDARHNKPRIGRILTARGRDATDVAIVTSFGPCTRAGFKVTTEEVTEATLGEAYRDLKFGGD